MSQTPPHIARLVRRLAGAVAVGGLLLAAGTAAAAEPPDQNDPCASAGRDTCGTTGVGSYQRYRYGIRWFGDYRGAIAGIPPSFCIDLRFWYPGKNYGYVEGTAEGLKNRAGQRVPTGKLQRMAYVLWNYGRSNSANQQGAVMLYVHGLMNDGAPGEAAPNAIGPTVAALVARMTTEANRYHGPYRMRAALGGGLKVGTQATGTVRVLSASGAAVPGVRVTLSADGATGVPRTVTTAANGIGTFTYTPAAAQGVEVTATTQAMASDLPRIFNPTRGKSARNGQRLATAASQQLTVTATSDVSKTKITVTTKARPAKLLTTAATRDNITLTGLPTSRRTTVNVKLFGPFRTTGQIACTGEPAAQGTVGVTKSGTVASPAFRPTTPGIYTYQITIEGTENFAGVTTPCGVPAETIRVETQPNVRTQASTARTPVGQPLSDTAIVSGLNGETADVQVSLYGPFGSADQVNCDGAPIWSGTVTARGDGQYVTDTFTPTVAGYYTYRESLLANDFVRAFEGKCGEVSEGVIVTGAPKITSQISALQPKLGQSITDRVILTGMGALATKINMELWGPYATREQVNCTGDPAWTGTIDAEVGDGVHTTEAVTLDRVGYYTYRASIAETDANTGILTPCGEVSETAQVTAQPSVTTLASAEVVRPGSQIYDRVRVRGLGATQATVELELFGPFATRAAINCDATPLWKGRFTVDGDGEHRSPGITVPKAGFYSFREKLLGTTQIVGTEGVCGVTAETSLAAPLIVTGRGDIAGSGATVQKQTGRSAPVRVKVADLGINAPVLSVGIDVAGGVLDVPSDIAKLGWWRDGAAPADAAGVTLIAGHVDSARAGLGAFGTLKNATTRTRITVTTANGRTRTYRVVSVRTMPKPQLPTGIFTIRGRPRLVLVTCGGPFIPSEGHYRDNVVVTAQPVG